MWARTKRPDLTDEGIVTLIGASVWSGAAKACGAAGYHAETAADLVPAIEAALKEPGPAVIEVVVDAYERPAMPDRLQA